MSKATYSEKDHEKDLSKERMDRCIPVAKEVMKLIAAHDGVMGDVTQDQMDESYDGVAKSILQLYLDKNILVSEVNFINSLMQQIIGGPLNIVSGAVNRQLKTAEQSVFGKDLPEVTFQELDVFLKNANKKLDKV